MAFILNSKVDVKEEWIKCDVTGIEQLVTNADAKKYDIAMDRARSKSMMTAGADLTAVLDSDLTNAETVALLIGAYVVKDWKGVTDEKGEPVLFTKENYLALANQNDAPANKALEKFTQLREAAKTEVKKLKGK